MQLHIQVVNCAHHICRNSGTKHVSEAKGVKREENKEARRDLHFTLPVEMTSDG